MTPQELKNSILQLAIQGRLVEQRPEEGTATELLRTIPRHGTHGTTRTHRTGSRVPCRVPSVSSVPTVPSVPPEEQPFDIPDSWVWVRIGDIFDLINGKAFKPSDWSDRGIPIVRIQNLNDVNTPYHCFAGNIEEKYILNGGELLFSWSGTPGTSFGAFIWRGGKAVLNQHIFIMFPRIKLDYEYAKHALNGELPIFISKAHGGAGLQHITRSEFDSCYLPLPPLPEQKRIVAKIEELLPLIDRYEKAWGKLEEFNRRFPVDMQKSVLQMAIQGKLVEQRPEEGTAAELLRAILRHGIHETTRTHRTESRVPCRVPSVSPVPVVPSVPPEEQPFDIPESWVWVRLGNLAFKVTDGTHKTPRYADKGVRFVSAKNLSNGCLRFEGCKYITEQEHKELFSRCNPGKGDLLLSKSGSIGAVALVDVEFEFSLFESLALVKFDQKLIFPLYLKYAVQNACFNLDPESIRGVAVKHLPIADIKSIPIPLPPLDEQKRIVARLEEILPLCERLKGSLEDTP